MWVSWENINIPASYKCARSNHLLHKTSIGKLPIDIKFVLQSLVVLSMNDVLILFFLT
jgi:hypothetical protein